MSSKEERDKRRAERLAAERRAASDERRRLIIGYVAAGVLTVAVAVGIVIVIAGGGSGSGGNQSAESDENPNAHIQVLSGKTNGIAPDNREGTAPPKVKQADLKLAAKAAGCDLRLDLPNEGQTHIRPGDPVPDYKTNPPTSGNHILPPFQQADGAYSEPPNPQYVVHSLEHGRVEIQYSPKLSEDDQLVIKGVFDDDPDGMLLYPNPDMPYEIATTAWTQLMGCDTYRGAATLDAIRAFRDVYRGQGPEGQIPVTLSG